MTTCMARLLASGSSLVRINRFAGANDMAGDTDIESGSFAPTTVVNIANPHTNARTFIAVSPSRWNVCHPDDQALQSAGHADFQKSAQVRHPRWRECARARSVRLHAQVNPLERVDYLQRCDR